MGHYTADAEGVARGYRDRLTPQTRSQADIHAAIDAADVHPEVASIARNSVGDPNLPAFLRATATDVDPQYAGQFHQLADKVEAAMKPPGHMYEVKINADPAHFLDWDKPLDQQHPEVIKAFARLDPDLTDRLAAHAESRGMNSPLEVPEDATGGDLVRMLEHHNVTDAPSEVADILHEAGIPGIRYLDASSRGAGEGSRNSVVFDPATMEIIRKYGLAHCPARCGGSGGNTRNASIMTLPQSVTVTWTADGLVIEPNEPPPITPPTPGTGVQAKRIADLIESFGVNTFSSLDEHNICKSVAC